MDNWNMEKALELFAKLITGENVSSSENTDLYEEYNSNMEMYNIFANMIEKLNLTLYQYKGALFITAGEKNKVFGYTNEELRKMLGLKVNKELYMCYFIIYNIITLFYKDSSSYTLQEYIKSEDVLRSVDGSLSSIISKMDVIVKNELEENSFSAIALLWDELPLTHSTDLSVNARAYKSSKLGYIKIVFNFLKEQNLFIEVEERYYASVRFKALIENYFEDFRGRLYAIMSEGGLN
ncbi:DUF6063 family protein [Clostridium estertheticum]|uniref:DUF6063 family protein n=1 Tax=Clostridium estertheticum TaxID=238834 RepID=UPI001C7D23E7|nr:DUF6063 family protein [Clostridium estertheticum]MBX4260996.1 hypothetical protein [Clostridium estertheticum]MCB2340547.1 DUF6063 family protein [Clostridium estertheticum]WLC71836.1 hypothetical protein KTC96_07505 [Clostridium estertheticum]